LIGHWKGVYKSADITTPQLAIVGYYDTVRAGRLEEFALIVPKDAVVKRIESKYSIYYLVTTVDGKEFAFEVTLGDPERASTACETSIDHVKKLLKEKEIFEKAEPLW
jgi:hypothetical protein